MLPEGPVRADHHHYLHLRCFWIWLSPNSVSCHLSCHSLPTSRTCWYFSLGNPAYTSFDLSSLKISTPYLGSFYSIYHSVGCGGMLLRATFNGIAGEEGSWLIASLHPSGTASPSGPTAFMLRPHSPRKLPAPNEHSWGGWAEESCQITAGTQGDSVSKRLDSEGHWPPGLPCFPVAWHLWGSDVSVQMVGRAHLTAKGVLNKRLLFYGPRAGGRDGGEREGPGVEKYCVQSRLQADKVLAISEANQGLPHLHKSS